METEYPDGSEKQQQSEEGSIYRELGHIRATLDNLSDRAQQFMRHEEEVTRRIENLLMHNARIEDRAQRQGERIGTLENVVSAHVEYISQQQAIQKQIAKWLPVFAVIFAGAFGWVALKFYEGVIHDELENASPWWRQQMHHYPGSNKQ